MVVVVVLCCAAGAGAMTVVEPAGVVVVTAAVLSVEAEVVVLFVVVVESLSAKARLGPARMAHSAAMGRSVFFIPMLGASGMPSRLEAGLSGLGGGGFNFLEIFVARDKPGEVHADLVQMERGSSVLCCS